MMIMLFEKSTVRPCPSVSRPSSRICRRMLNTSEWAFSISSRRTTVYGWRRTASVEKPAFFVPDVARRRADQPRDRVLLHVLGHVDADHARLVVEKHLGQRSGQLGLPHSRRTDEHEGADRLVRAN